ncbi:unnamed protein product [Phytophthora fragariaefolia]|uniref:Unnamed protein product n=1 Tax=Phytophthora fragariaefolia TaxID=1490495 RepID=A0A9W7D6Z7_9STRA|nr:unnamed protein product [Phytophthora fragariaefolia]
MKATAATLPTIMKIIVLVPRTLLPPASPPLAGDRLPSPESALALLPLSSVIGDSFNTPFDEVASVVSDDEADDSLDDDDAEDSDVEDVRDVVESEPSEPSDLEVASLPSDPLRLESSLEVLDPVDPELVSADEDKLLVAALELELKNKFELADPVSEEVSDVDVTADALSDEEPVLEGAPEPSDETPDDDSAVFPSEPASEFDVEDGIAVTGGGLVGVAIGVDVGVEDALPEPELGTAVTGGGLVGLGIGVAVAVGVLLEPEAELDDN